MAIYFFHLHDGTGILRDEEGRWLEDVDQVAPTALKDARSMLSADVRAGFLKLDQYIDVEDASATLVHRLNFADAVALVRR